MTPKPSLEEIMQFFALEPIPVEGGLYRQAYRSALELPGKLLGSGVNQDALHPAGTAILFVLTNEPGSFSAVHRLVKDEMYHFYFGDPVELLLLHPDGRSETILLGQDILNGQKVQYVVPAGVWQGSHLVTGSVRAGYGYALMGTTMGPGFHVTDFEAGIRSELLAAYPEEEERIKALTRIGTSKTRY